MTIRTKIGMGFRLMFKMLPLKKRIMVFSYWGTQKSDSPYQIYKYIKKTYPEANIVFWRKKGGSRLASNRSAIQRLYYRTTSKIIVDNLFAENVFMVDNERGRKEAENLALVCERAKQKYVTTWHGTPLKKIERDRMGSTITDCIINKPMYQIMGNTYTADILKHIFFDKTQVKLFGSPRNDILINANNEKRLKIKEKMKLPQDKNIVLYAPTFRSEIDVSKSYVKPSGIEQMDIFDFDRLFRALQERLGGEWVMVLRFHHLVSNMVDWKQLEEKYPNRFINGNQHEDIAEYLLCSDVLITDYSSCMFDYAILNRPVFLFCHDLEHYGNEERGFYMDIRKLPFPLAEDFDNLYDNIKNFDNEIYCEKLEEMKKQMGYCEDGHATEKAGDFIYRLLEDD